MREETEEFEQMLENNGTKEAIAKYYKDNWMQIAGAVITITLLAGLAISDIPVWARSIGVIGLLLANYGVNKYANC